MVLTVQEEALVKAIRALPAPEAQKILNWASQLADLSKGREMEWSDSWTEQDLADVTAASLRRFEERERDES